MMLSDAFDHSKSFYVIHYTENGSKSKELNITDNDIRDVGKNEVIIHLADVSQIILGKNTQILMTNSDAKQYGNNHFFTLIDCNNNALNCQIFEGQRNEMINCIIEHMAKHKSLQQFNWNKIKLQIDNVPNDEIFEIALIPNTKTKKKTKTKSWNVIRYKSHKHKPMIVELECDKLINGINHSKIISYLRDIERIYVGKCTKSLKENESAKLKQQCAFFSLITANNYLFDFEVISALKREEMICSIIDGMNGLKNGRKIPKKGIEKTKELIHFLQGDSKKRLKIEFVKVDNSMETMTRASSTTTSTPLIGSLDSEQSMFMNDNFNSSSNSNSQRQSIVKLTKERDALRQMLEQEQMSAIQPEAESSSESSNESNAVLLGRDLEINELKKKIVEMQQHMKNGEDFEQNIKELRAECNEKDEEIYALKQKVTALEQKVIAMDLEKKELEKQLEKDNVKGEELADFATDLQMQHEEDLRRMQSLEKNHLAIEFEQVKIENEYLKNNQNKLKDEIKRLLKNKLSKTEKKWRKSKSQSMNKELEQNQQIIKDLRMKVRILESQVGNKRRSGGSAYTNGEQDKLQRLDEEIRRFRTNSFLIQPDERLEELEGENEALRIRNDCLKRNEGKMHDEIERLIKKNKELIAYWKNVKKIWTTIDTKKIFGLLNA